MSAEYSARITVTGGMGDNGDVYKRTFNGSCRVGLKKGKGSIAQRAEAYLQAVSKSRPAGAPPMVTASSKPQLPRLEVVSRVAAIPIVESGIGVTEKIYFRIKESNPLFRWYLSLYEKTLSTGVQLALPAVHLLEAPIHQLDRFLCASLDVVEKRVPSIHLPPQTMYSETRQYVLRRADSVKQLGTAVLDSRVTCATASALDRALSTADKYVDKYLPPDTKDPVDVSIIVQDAEWSGGSGRAAAAQAVQHGARLRRKLQRRLTRQALAEAKAIREQIHVLVYVAELVATDPVLAWKKAKELYASLSQPEPENQARPETLEQLVVLLARETARKVVHLVNYTHTDLPRNVSTGLAVVTKHLSSAADALLKTLPVDSALAEVRGWRSRLEQLLQQLQASSKVYLEHLAIFLAGNEEREKIAPRSSLDQREDLAAINGVN
ncbi:lipid storage droplets surface-binding protein 1 isoform X3 [Leguminivora glycinivorella]|uniref:lipid storage droplets surface-binding protein 1 isoform X1 n=1 Tax=Leguminivora glycinivorella TaxID=1035111 RepID=UPI00200C36F7|nr:lipid storage droplets surface-binding protein 1 isoform X1 [Leguminivora glycinivorella]XP_047999491.1 lipid storage droplets surface-binding protein 1 isoform X2 [Leguminivora glycinivorella]XP_047999498.1 lipid storage droplets surface-binding protein 1 isoform X3 [Leguminivora glycinivorella]